MTTEKNIVSYETLYPETVQGGVEVKDDIIDLKNTWSSYEINTKLDELEEGLTQAIEDIDLSPYATNTALSEGLAAKQNSLGYTAENTANKNVANGYLGLDDIGRQNSIFTKIPKTKYGFWYSFLSVGLNNAGSIIEGGVASGVTYSSSGTNAVKLKSGSLGSWSIPTIFIALNGSGYAYRSFFDSNVKIASDSTIQSEIAIAVRLSAKQSNTTFAIGNVTWSAGSWTGTGLIITQDPTINSGNFRVGKVINGSFTPYSTSTAIIGEKSTKLRIFYNKAIETAYFYINHTLVYTMTSVNLASDAIYPARIIFGSTDGTEASIIRAVSFLYIAYEVDINE